jgi:hypothetical protein
VSSIAILGRAWAPEVMKERPEKKYRHRALDDILESIEELRYYREKFWPKKVGGEGEGRNREGRTKKFEKGVHTLDVESGTENSQ